MKKQWIIILFFLVHFAFWGEDIHSENYYAYTSNYYIQKDITIIRNTINFINSNPQIEDKQLLKLAAFYIALFDDQPLIKKEFENKFVEFLEHKNMIQYALETDLSTFLNGRQYTATWNDIFWNMFFATGNTDYLDKLIETIQFNAEREDLNLFMAGASAKWSFSSNIQQHKKIEEYVIQLIETQPDKYNFLNELLTLDLAVFRQITVDILKEQKEKGIW